VSTVELNEQLILNPPRSTRDLAPEEIARNGDEDLKTRLRTRAFELGALRSGKFRLVSGAKTDRYFDGRLLSLDPKGSDLIAEWLWSQISDRDDIDAVGGPAVAAVPMVGALIHRAAKEKTWLKGFFVRDAAKKHGMQNIIEGPIKELKRLMVIQSIPPVCS